MNKSLSRCLGFLLGCLLPTASALGATFLPIPFSPQLPYSSGATAISADGSTVVGTASGDLGGDGFRWTQASGTIPLGFASEYSYADVSDVSGDGSVTTASYLDVFGPVYGYRWFANGGLSTIPNLPAGTNYNQPFAITDDATMIVGASASNGSNPEAYRYVPATNAITGLGKPLNGQSWAYGVSNDGQTIVGHQTGNGGLNEGFVWTALTGRMSIGDLPGGTTASIARAVSSDGAVVVGQSNGTPGPQAIRWSNGVMTSLGDLPGGVAASDAHGVSADGSIIVGGGNSSTGSEAFYWNGQMFNLDTILTEKLGAPLANWRLAAATDVTPDVTPDGRTVVGYGVNPAGQTQAWRAQLIDMNWKNPGGGAWSNIANWDLPLLPASIDAVVISSATTLSVDGPPTSATVKSLAIGGGAGMATLRLAAENGGNVQAVQSIAVLANGVLELANGRTASAPTVSNSGMIRGSGVLGGVLTNGAQGTIVAATGDRLSIAGLLANNGNVQAIGGELTVTGAATNNTDGIIYARGGIVRFNAGLANSGSVAISTGGNDVFGDINNNAAGKILVSGGGAVTFYDDVLNNGSLKVSKIGSTTSAAVFLGSYGGSGNSSGGGDLFFEGDLRPGNSPASVTFDNNVSFGDGATTTIELAGATSGLFDHINVTGELALGGTLSVAFLGGFTPSPGQSFDILDWGTVGGTFASVNLPTLGEGITWDASRLYSHGELSVSPARIPGDIDLDNDVDRADAARFARSFGLESGAAWSTGDFNADGATTLADWALLQSHLGTIHPSPSAAAAVPEPSALCLATLCAMTLLARARRSSQPEV